MKRRFPAAAALAATAALAGAPPAPAQDPGVQVNPDSPSGVEYDLPLERARRQARGERGTAAPSGGEQAPTALFGEGVEPPAGGGASGQSGASTGGQGGSGRKPRSGRDAPLPPEVVAAAARPVTTAGDGGSSLLYSAGGALVVMAGALLGLALRRRRG